MAESSLSERIAAVVSTVPAGTVATYGQVAALAGNPKAARQVARVLRMWSNRRGLPWHRVLGAGGVIRLPAGAGGEEQAFLLQSEGVEVVKGTVDLARYGFDPASNRETPR